MYWILYIIYPKTCQALTSEVSLLLFLHVGESSSEVRQSMMTLIRCYLGGGKL